MVRSTQTKILAVLAGMAGVLLLVGIAIAVVAARSGQASVGGLGWTLPLLLGMLVALGVLLLLERSSDGRADSAAEGASCPACGKPLVEAWRLCPHCGELLECQMALPPEGGPIRE